MRNCSSQDAASSALHPFGGMCFAGLRSVVENTNRVLPGIGQLLAVKVMGWAMFKEPLSLGVKSEAQIAFAGKNVLNLVGKYDAEL